MRRSIAMLLLSGACSTTSTNTIGPYVRGIVPAQGGIQVSTCAITYASTTQHFNFGFWELFGGHSNNDKESEIREGNCFQQLVPTEVAP